MPDLTVARLVVTDTLTGEGAGAPSGENLGGGVELHVGTSDAGVLQYRTLAAGAGVSLATTGNLVTVAATGGGASAENIGGGAGLYSGVGGEGTLQFRSLVPGTGIVLGTGEGTCTITAVPVIGTGAARGTQSVAFGDSAVAGDYGTALGYSTDAGLEGQAVGCNATAHSQGSAAFGRSAVGEGEFSLALGYFSLARGYGSVAQGFEAISAELHAQAYGSQASAYGEYSLACGFAAAAMGASSLALGRNSAASGALSIAIGRDAVSRVPGTTVLGGPQCLRRTDEGAAPGFRGGSGATVFLSTGVVGLGAIGTYSIEVPAEAIFYPTALSVLDIAGDSSVTPAAFTAGFDGGSGASYYLATGVADGLARRYATLQGFRGTNLPTIKITLTAGFASACRFVWEGILVEREAA